MRRGTTAGLLAGAVALSGVLPAAAGAVTGTVALTGTGQVGSLTVGSSTTAQVEKVWGKPGAVSTGSYPGSGKYTALGYGHCKKTAYTCDTLFYIGSNGRFDALETQSSQFVYSGVKVGGSASAASKTLKQPIYNADEGPEIQVITKTITLLVHSKGGKVDSKTEKVSGGTVDAIVIDAVHHGIDFEM